MFKNLFLLTIALYFISLNAFAAEESVLSPVIQKELVPIENTPSVKTNEMSIEQAPVTTPVAQAPTTAPVAPKAPKIAQAPNAKKSAATEGVRAGDIYVSCKDYFQNSFNNKENISKRATCNGYFFGVGSTLLTLDTYGLNTNICLPTDITTHQVIQTFLDWSKANTDNLSIQAADATLRALGARFPCESQQ
jgi:hypothetical protein